MYLITNIQKQITYTEVSNNTIVSTAFQGACNEILTLNLPSLCCIKQCKIFPIRITINSPACTWTYSRHRCGCMNYIHTCDVRIIYPHVIIDNVKKTDMFHAGKHTRLCRMFLFININMKTEIFQPYWQIQLVGNI